jgi:hypothetical protein
MSSTIMTSVRAILGILLVAALNRAETPVAAAAPQPQLDAKKPSELEAVKSIIDGMQGAGARLKRGDTGPDTRQIQQKVVKDIQKLIDAAKSKSSNNNSQQNSPSRQQSGSQSPSESSQSQQSQSQQPQGQDTGGKPAGPSQPGRKSGVGKPLASEKTGTARQQRPLFREVWGHLPPALRERAPSDFHESILPAYDDLVRRYFEAILDGTSSTPNRSGQAAAPERPPGSPAPESPTQ